MLCPDVHVATPPPVVPHCLLCHVMEHLRTSPAMSCDVATHRQRCSQAATYIASDVARWDLRRAGSGEFRTLGTIKSASGSAILSIRSASGVGSGAGSAILPIRCRICPAVDQHAWCGGVRSAAEYTLLSISSASGGQISCRICHRITCRICPTVAQISYRHRSTAGRHLI